MAPPIHARSNSYDYCFLNGSGSVGSTTCQQLCSVAEIELDLKSCSINSTGEQLSSVAKTTRIEVEREPNSNGGKQLSIPKQLSLAVPGTTERDWASLPTDLVLSIAEQLCVVDAIRFAAVCKPWRCATSPRNGRLCLQKKPYLLLRSRDDTECLLQDFLSSSDRRCCHRIDPLPEILEGDKWYVGSQFGWIAVVDKFSNPSLVNPLTRSQIHLPPISTLSDIVRPIYNAEDGSISGYDFLNNGDKQFHPCALEWFRYQGIMKLVLSSSPATGNFYALCILGGCKAQLVYMRPADTKWSLVEDDMIKDYVEDIIFHDGHFLMLTVCGSLYVIDFVSPVFRFIKIANNYGEPNFFSRHLVESHGALMQVLRDRKYPEGEVQGRTNYIAVLQLVPDMHDWIPVTNLKDQSILLGFYSVSLSATNIPELKENCIYFTDDDVTFEYSESKTNEGNLMIPDTGVFSLEDGSAEIVPIATPDARFNWRPPIWITPCAT